MAAIRASIEATAPEERLRLITAALAEINRRHLEALLQLPAGGCGGRCLAPSFRSAFRSLEKERALNLQRHKQTTAVINPMVRR
jgi:hypothetical protein